MGGEDAQEKEQVSEAGPEQLLVLPVTEAEGRVCGITPFYSEHKLTQHRVHSWVSAHGWSQQEGKAPTFQVTKEELSHTPKRLTRTRHPLPHADVLMPAWRGLQ